jgi:hypothetical protein
MTFRVAPARFGGGVLAHRYGTPEGTTYAPARRMRIVLIVVFAQDTKQHAAVVEFS